MSDNGVLEAAGDSHVPGYVRLCRQQGNQMCWSCRPHVQQLRALQQPSAYGSSGITDL